ncbi:hypothetical transcript [Echinococcus multilocularis]|uniref:Hypothetical transcript n=1 Tax=Echinococcus multilocularis TaxID=6211 RepID=A0A068XZK4_ECHMU|nr:hypothetical transcript [Echinococcus multilocularis]
MSVVVTHIPRFHSRDGYTGPKYPPEGTCSAVLLERKFVASHGPPPRIDAARLARTITVQRGSQRDVSICVFRDRLLLKVTGRGPDLPEIFFDDIVQIELLSSKRNILFILCGQRGIGCYYFFKITDYGMAERIKELADHVNPNLMHGQQDYGAPMHNFHYYRMQERQPLNVYAYDNQRIDRDYSAPPSVSSKGSNTTSVVSLQRQNSFIGWEGYRGNQDARRGRFFQSKQSSIDPYQSSSRSRSPSLRESNKTLYIKAQGGASRRKASSIRRKRQPLLGTEDNRPHSRPVSRPGNRNDKRKHGLRSAIAPRKYKSSERPKPRTFILDSRTGRSYKAATIARRDCDTETKSDLSESTYDLADKVQIGRHPYPHEPRLRNVDHQVEEINDYDWESLDSWDFEEGKAFRPFEGETFNAPRTQGRHPKDEDFTNGEESNSSVDSLYLERDMQQGTNFHQHNVNYLPELEKKFHQFNLK